MNGLKKLSQNGRTAIKRAHDIAEQSGGKSVGLEHLFLALLQDKTFISSQVLSSFGADFSRFSQQIMSSSGRSLLSKKSIDLSSEVIEAIQRAYLISKELSHVYVGTEHLLIALFTFESNLLVSELSRIGLTRKSVQERVLAVASYPPGVFVHVGSKDDEGDGDSILESLGRDLTELAREKKLLPVVGRRKEIDKMLQVLARRTKNNPILVGESGVGKTAIAEGLAQRIVEGKVPLSLRDKKVISIDTASIVAGSKVRGELEEKVLDIIEEARQDKDVILFIDEIHTILGAGSASGGSLDIADILKPALANGELRCIGATTISAYQNIFEEDAALSRRFQPVEVEELSVEESLVVLKKIKKIFEEFHGVSIDQKALETAAKLSDRYIYERFLPDKAIDLVDEALARMKLEKEGNASSSVKVRQKLTTVKRAKENAIAEQNFELALDKRAVEEELREELERKKKEMSEADKGKIFSVTAEDIQKIVSELTGIPLKTLSQEERDSIKNIDKVLNKFIIGQSEAVESVARALKRSRVGISSKDRPSASFLFLGPTGVGKTELARVVARELFGSEKNLIQVDMSEMMEPHSVSKIIGAPPGYVGYQEGGQLTDQIRRRPYSVVLFDEIEKAHPDVLNLLLQLLEYGQLTDSKGRVASFKNAIIVLTSNIGAEEISEDAALGFATDLDIKSGEDLDRAYEEMKDILIGELKAELRPEFLNRLDDIVIFRSLSSKDAAKIVKLLIKDLNKRLSGRNLKVVVTPVIVKYIVENGFDKEYGARPIRRLIQDEIEALVADYVLEHGENETNKIRRINIKKTDQGLSI